MEESIQKPKFSVSAEVFDWLEALLVSVVVIIFIFSFVFRIVKVDGSSMEHTLHDEDYLIITQYNYQPKQFDLVVVAAESAELPDQSDKKAHEKLLIKRIIALENQVVDINYELGTVTVNGEVLDEPYIQKNYDDHMIPPSRESISYPYTVPPGKVFVMGDNRNNSTDSRVLGALDKMEISGRAIIRAFPLPTFRTFFKIPGTSPIF